MLNGRFFSGFFLPVLSAVLHCSARLPIHTLNYRTVLSVVPVLLTGCMFECNIAQRRSVAELCIFSKIRCNPIYPLVGASASQYPSRTSAIPYLNTAIPVGSLYVDTCLIPQYGTSAIPIYMSYTCHRVLHAVLPY